MKVATDTPAPVIVVEVVCSTEPNLDPAIPTAAEYAALPLWAQRRWMSTIHEAYCIAIRTNAHQMRAALLGMLHAYLGLYRPPPRRSLVPFYEDTFDAVGGRRVGRRVQ